MFSLSELSQDEMVVLKRINTIGKVTSDGLARDLGEPYTVEGLSAYLRSLEERSLVRKAQGNGSVYELSPLGLIAIGALPETAKKAYVPVAREKCFNFYTGTGSDKFTQLFACSLSDFRDKVKQVDAKSLEFHVQRGDVSRWLKDVLDEPTLAKEFERLRSLGVSGEVLRTRIAKLVDNRIQSLGSSTGRVWR